MKIDSRSMEKIEATAKCQKYLTPILRKKKAIPLDSIGSPRNNQLLDFLYCQTKASKTCKKADKAYRSCHASVMGTGSYDGRKHCADELEALFHCISGSEE